MTSNFLSQASRMLYQIRQPQTSLCTTSSSYNFQLPHGRHGHGGHGGHVAHGGRGEHGGGGEHGGHGHGTGKTAI